MFVYSETSIFIYLRELIWGFTHTQPAPTTRPLSLFLSCLPSLSLNFFFSCQKDQEIFTSESKWRLPCNKEHRPFEITGEYVCTPIVEVNVTFQKSPLVPSWRDVPCIPIRNNYYVSVRVLMIWWPSDRHLTLLLFTSQGDPQSPHPET